MSTNDENPYVVRWAKFADGERMPFLLKRDTGVPIEAPTYWAIANRRALGKQANTLFNELRCLMYLYLWADLRSVDLSERLAGGVFLSLSEIIDLVGFCGWSLKDILAEMSAVAPKVVKLSSRRPSTRSSVQSVEKRNRLSVIRSFLEFTSADHLSQLQQWPDRWSIFEKIRRECLERLGEHISGLHKPNRDDLGKREGLDFSVMKRLRAVIEPDHPENPFEPDVRFRNYVILRLLLELGIRRGELLGLYVDDCDLNSKSGTVTIHRRPDDPLDPRRSKPAAKTAARILKLSPRMTELVHEWAAHHRRKLPVGRNNPFLIVNIRDGRPMSPSNINKMFEALRSRVPGLPKELSPHVLRHSWNDAFSEQVDEKGVSEENEIKWRMRLMGWRSELTARHYTRRTTRRRSDEVLLAMQERFEIKLDAEGEKNGN